jgi:FlaA1/EpsC-like NDP-sugar epimerase
VAEIFIAMASVCPAFLREVTELCTDTGLPFRILPRNAGLFDGDVSLRQLRNIRVEDLLGREPVRLELPELARDLAGRSVLITGAAGSIGSELARQVALHAPRKLVLLDQAESDLYFVELEIRERHPGLEVVPVVGDILDAERMRAVFRRHRPDRVFHAAAYKHVPLMELNIREAVQNNVLGSLRMIELAGEMEVERFVLISTDKAVRPSSVMGATKRLAELTLLAARVRYPRTSYRAVRFGNVLGSQGSVIPLFRRQIETSGVVTVTDPEVTRYFMSIPEAVQLVLQASILEEGSGRIAMLEMGEPIRILDLARNLIRLAGLREGVDVHIRITGLRPGEKLHEELVHEDEETIPTPVRSVRIVLPRAGEEDGVERLLEELRVLRHWIPSAQDGQLKEHLTRLVRSFGTRKEREPVVEPMKRMVAGGD